MAAFNPGQIVFVSTADATDVWKNLWPERLILGWVIQDEYVVLDAEGKVAIKQLSAANPQLDGLRIAGPSGAMPHGLQNANLQRFAGGPPVGVALNALLAEGKMHVTSERQARGLGGPVGGAAVPAAALTPVVVPLPLPTEPVAPPIAAGPGGTTLTPPPTLLVRYAGASRTWVPTPLLEDAHKLDPDNPSQEGAHHRMGEDEAGGGAPKGGAEALRSHVAQESAKESAVAKERRKAMEARMAKAGSGG